MACSRMTYTAVINRLEKQLEKSMARQVLDPNRPDYGAFLHPVHGMASANHTGNAHDLTTACLLFFADGSAYEGDERLFERILLSADFQRRAQRPSGLIDLESVNWESPPDTGFTIQLLAPVVELARARVQGDPRAAAICDSLEKYVKSAAHGMVGRGFHTPNHRWVVCSALALTMRLFPDFQEDKNVRNYFEAIMAETIDINEDGEYSERSTGVYNAVCNRSLRMIADALDMPEYLAPVRKNLDFMCHLLHEDGTVVTTFSTRQDRRRRVVPVGIADSFFDMAQRDQNGMWAHAADILFANGSDAPHAAWLLHPFLINPHYRQDSLPRMALPQSYRHVFPSSGLMRVKRSELSATVSAGNTAFLSLRCGDVTLEAVKIAGTYHSSTNFSGDELEAIDSGVRLIHRGAMRRTPGFELPLGRPVPYGQFYDQRDQRQRWTLPVMDIVLEVMEVQPGEFNLGLKTEGGLDGVLFQVELCFQGPGYWETQDQVSAVTNGQTAILKRGYGIFHRDTHAVKVGPGGMVHRDWHMRGTEPEPETFRVLLPLTAPMDHSVTIRCGRWCPVTLDVLPLEER